MSRFLPELSPLIPCVVSSGPLSLYSHFALSPSVPLWRSAAHFEELVGTGLAGFGTGAIPLWTFGSVYVSRPLCTIFP